jgi:hypothetical protein
MDEFHGDAELLELEIQMDDARPFEVWAAEFADWHGEDSGFAPHLYVEDKQGLSWWGR